MDGDVGVDDAPAVVGQHDEAEQEPDSGSGDDEEIAGDGVAEVVPEEGALPWL